MGITKDVKKHIFQLIKVCILRGWSKRDHDGYLRILGRVDDVMNVSGHRMGTAEVENAINEHPKVIESAVVGYPHEIKGQGIYAYVICDIDNYSEANLIDEIKETVRNIIGQSLSLIKFKLYLAYQKLDQENNEKNFKKDS